MSLEDNDKKPKIHITESAQELYDDAPCGYVSFLTDGTIFNINSTLLNWLNFDKEEVIYKMKFPELFKIGGQIFFETHFFPLIRMQGFIKEINFDIVKKDKSTFPGLLNVNEIPAKGSNPLTYRATIFDITDRKKYEKELLAAKKKAEEDSHAKAEFLSTISHEIRTPLHAILGIGNLLHKTHLNKDQKEYARILKHSSENLMALVNNLLDLSKIEAQKVQLEERAFNLLNLVKMLQQTFKVKAAEKNIDLLVELDRNVPKEIIGDPVKLSQILTNLIGNAIKFTKDGSVTLSIEKLESLNTKSLLQFRVIDTGIGIPEDKLEAIFQEFSQASYDVSIEYGGTGLGLTISQKLLHLHNSKMHVQSEIGKGSEFSFNIWYRENQEFSSELEPKIGLEDQQIFKSARILIVDDNPANIYITSQFLTEWKLENEAAESGAQALEMIKNQEYDIVLLDLHMPKMNGYETAKAIRSCKLNNQPVIIALSATDRADVNYKMRKAGMNDHVPKPFQPEQLLEKLIHYLHNPDHYEMKKIPVIKVSELSKDKGQTNEEKSKLDEGSRNSFDVSKFVKMSNQNSHYLEKFITSTLEALTIYEQEFQEAAKEKNPKKLAELIHKCTMTIFYIKADKLSVLMNEVQRLLKKEETDPKVLQRKINNCNKEFQHIITGLTNLQVEELLEHSV